MYISDEAWTKYIDRLRKVNEKAAQEMFHYLSTHEWWKSKQAKKAALDVAFALSTKYGEASAELACEYHDFVMEEAMRNVDRLFENSRKENIRRLRPAEPAEPPTYGEVAKAFYGAAKGGNEKVMSQTVGRLVKQTGADTTLKNALRDGAQFAWIPHGDTCPFCLMIASRGWQYASKKTIQGGHAEHIHANCDCTFAVRFDDRTNVEGYDPDLYKRMYYDAGDTPKERLNTMRRIHYAENREEINAQKRAAYAIRKGRDGLNYESSNADSYYNYASKNGIIQLEKFKEKYTGISFDRELIGWDTDELKRQIERAKYNEDADEMLRLQDLLRRVEEGYLKPMDQQVLSEFLTGMDDMLTRYPQLYKDGWIRKILFDDKDKSALAFVIPGRPNVYIHKRLSSKRYREDARVAGYHEMVHIIENMLGIGKNDEKAKKIVQQAFVRAGIDGRTKEANNIRIRVAGIKYRDNPHEIIAHSLDKNYSGNGNLFTRALESIIEEMIENVS